MGAEGAAAAEQEGIQNGNEEEEEEEENEPQQQQQQQRKKADEEEEQQQASSLLPPSFLPASSPNPSCHPSPPSSLSSRFLPLALPPIPSCPPSCLLMSLSALESSVKPCPCAPMSTYELCSKAIVHVLRTGCDSFSTPTGRVGSSVTSPVPRSASWSVSAAITSSLHRPRFAISHHYFF